MTALSDSEVIALMRGDSLLNKVRRMIFSEAASIDRSLTHPDPPSPVEVRRREFAAAQRVLDLVLALDHATHPEPHQDRRESGASSPLGLAFLTGFLCLTAFAGAIYRLQKATPAGRHYHPIPLAQIAQAPPGDPIVPTHVVTYGTVHMVRQEADGDLHVRLCAQDDPATCIVLECIPEVPCKAPRYGDHVTARGISRWDTAHRWAEIHPVLSLEVDN